jgi:tetrapyrrole methylase family protein / MazG family protein
MAKRYPPIPLREFERFVRVVRRLRRDCPWDREQTHQSIRHSLIEEAYEVVESLDGNDLPALRNELGDILLHVVLHATMAEQADEFTLRDVLKEVNEKLIRRHPHVFGTTTAATAGDVTLNWERLKMSEGRTSVLDGVPGGLPALQRALRVQERAAKVGFDWEKLEDVWKKVEEETQELRQALASGDAAEAEEEFGDFLFAMVNYGRYLGIHPENALRRTVDKFIRRFHYIEAELRRRGKDPAESTLAEMDEIWNEAKREV